MKIVTWNCNGAFRRKYHLLDRFNADIYIIQECENPAETIHAPFNSWASNFIWNGVNKNKGVVIFCKQEMKLDRNDWDANGLKHFIAGCINDEINIVGVWNHHANSPNFRYIGQFWKYLQLHKKLMNNCVIGGDFNSNTIWDEWDRWWNHSDVVRELEEIEIRSLYHEFYSEVQGKESRPTFYLQRNISKPYHIDYVFADKRKFENVIDFSIGNIEEWLIHSDHLPIYIEIQLSNGKHK